MAVIYAEDFNAIANETLLNNVAGWTVSAQFPLTINSMVVNNGAVETRRTEDAVAFYGSQNDSYYAQADIAVNADDVFANYVGVAVRVIDYQNMIRTFIWDGGLRVTSFVAGAQTVLQEIKPLAIVSGDTHRLEVDGDTLRYYLNGTQQGTDMDITGILSGQNAGLFTSDSRLPAFDNFEVGNLVNDSISIDGVTDRQIINTIGATADFTLSGTYTGAIIPTVIQYRVEEFVGSTTITDWTTLDSSPSGGAYSGVITVPRGNYYRLMVRYGNDTSIEASSGRIGFGIVLEYAGQSNIDNTFGAYTPASINDNAGFHNGSNWALPSSGEFIESLNKLAVDNNCVVGCYNTAVPATSIDSHLSGGSNYSARQAALAAVGGKLSGILWGQGESNTASTKADYKTKLGTLYTDILTRTGQTASDLPMFIVQLGRNVGQSGNSGWDTIREAQTEFADETTGAVISHQTIDLPMADTLHRTSAGYVMEALRFADTYDFVLNGSAPSGRGAIPNSASYSGNNVTIAHSLNGGSQLTVPSSAFNLYELSNDDFSTSVTPTASTVNGTNEIVLTFTSIPSGTLKLRSHKGQDFTVSQFPTVDTTYNSQNVMTEPAVNGLSVSAGAVPNSPPVIDVTANKATYEAGEPITFTATASDVDDDTLTYLWSDGGETSTSITVTAPTGSTATTVTRSCTVSDGVETATDSITVNVNAEADTTKPSILVTYTGSLIVDQNGTLPVFDYTAVDNVDGDITADVVVGGDTPDASILGSYTITWDVTDSAGNAATQETRTVVVRDPNAGIPIEFRVNGSTLNAYLITQSFANTYNENQMNWLRSEGYTGSLNDMWYEYLDDLGYGGSLNDKVKAWKEG